MPLESKRPPINRERELYIAHLQRPLNLRRPPLAIDTLNFPSLDGILTTAKPSAFCVSKVPSVVTRRALPHHPYDTHGTRFFNSVLLSVRTNFTRTIGLSFLSPRPRSRIFRPFHQSKHSCRPSPDLAVLSCPVANWIVTPTFDPLDSSSLHHSLQRVTESDQGSSFVL